MRIINNRDEMTVTCNHCHSDLGVDCDDLHPLLETGGVVADYFIHCPVCHETVYIKLSQVPQRWLKRLDPH